MKVALILIACLPLGAGAITIVDEDFESYADTGSLGNIWSLGDGTLDTANGNPGQALFHPGTSASFTGGNTNSLVLAVAAPTASDTIRFSVDIFDNGAENTRATAGLRHSASTTNIFELGYFNDPEHFVYRVILFTDDDPNWVPFDIFDDSGQPLTNEPISGFHRFTTTFTATEATIGLDLGADGTLNASATVPIDFGGNGFDQLRLGGPSDVSSAGGFALFDNVLLEVIPEPSTTTLLALSTLALARRRRAT